MQDWLAITAYTEDTPYSFEAEKLELALLANGIKYAVYPYESTGDWRRNCQKIGRFVLNSLRLHNCPIVWLDADASIKAYPKLFDNYPNDIGLYKRLHTPKQKKQLGVDYHWDTGTMYFKPTTDVIGMLECQQRMFKLYDEGRMSTWPNLTWFLERYLHKPSIGELPVTYSYIFDTKQPEEVKYRGEAIIIHNQVSRKYKKLIGGDR